MGTALLTPTSIKAPLRGCGYRPDLLQTDFLLGEGQTIPLVAFAQSPADSRSACVAVLSETSGPRSAVEACRPLGAPLVFVCFQDTLQWWKQGAQSPEYRESIPANNVERFNGGSKGLSLRNTGRAFPQTTLSDSLRTTSGLSNLTRSTVQKLGGVSDRSTNSASSPSDSSCSLRSR